jgi:hypothetical protein
MCGKGLDVVSMHFAPRRMAAVLARVAVAAFDSIRPPHMRTTLAWWCYSALPCPVPLARTRGRHLRSGFGRRHSAANVWAWSAALFNCACIAHRAFAAEREFGNTPRFYFWNPKVVVVNEPLRPTLYPPTARVIPRRNRREPTASALAIHRLNFNRFGVA